MASLPSVDELIEDIMVTDKVGGTNIISVHFNVFVYIAAVCEKFGEHEKTVLYTTAALEADIAKAGTRMPSSRILAGLMQGRAFAALGRMPEAAAAFEPAAKLGDRYGYYLWAAFALRDLKLLVLDEMGHGDHASRRLSTAVRKMNTRLKLKGCEGMNLEALPAPDPEYVVTYTHKPEAPDCFLEPSHDQVLRAEYDGMRLMALHARATAEGVGAGDLDDAMDSPHPKSSLVELLLAKHAAKAQADLAARRRDLEALRVMQLYRRATECPGIEAVAVDEAMESDQPKATLVAMLLEHESCA
jgi:hypothetical protein